MAGPSGGPPPVPDSELTLLPLSLDPTPLSPTPVKFTVGETLPSGFASADLDQVNELARILLTASNPNVVFPPPPQPVVNERSKKIASAKEAGNVAFKKGQWQDAIKLYTMSADIAASRPVFEANVYARDELALALANRSAAYTSAGEYVNALVDAEAVIQLKRPWIKGHFRKGKALVAMSRFEEAREAFLLGLQFDPTAEVMILLPACFFYTRPAHNFALPPQELQNAVNEVEEQIRHRTRQSVSEA
jgi:translocation protein SEC72